MTDKYENLKARICEYADLNFEKYKEMALAIHARPEVSNYEFFACKTHSEQLKKQGFEVKVDVAGHRTGFSASYKSKKQGPVAVFLAEYDALNGLGHGCGHNIFGCVSSLAAACLKQVTDEVGGEVRVYGTPGEEGGENGSAKGSFVREGFFKDVDFALCEHPGKDSFNSLTSSSLACAPLDIEFWGRSAHAASAPEKGINALDALIMVYNAANALRQHLPSDVKIHGIIVDGGKAPNMVPDYAHAKFYIRAASMPVMMDTYKKLEKIVEGAALQTGAKGRMQPYQNIVENTIVTPLFDEVFKESLEEMGEKIGGAPVSIGSSDVGNVSQVVPTIQPNLSITRESIPNHSELMVKAACSEYGLETIRLGAKTLALTALKLMMDPERLQAIKAQHAEKLKDQA